MLFLQVLLPENLQQRVNDIAIIITINLTREKKITAALLEMIVIIDCWLDCGRCRSFFRADLVVKTCNK